MTQDYDFHRTPTHRSIAGWRTLQVLGLLGLFAMMALLAVGCAEGGGAFHGVSLTPTHPTNNPPAQPSPEPPAPSSEPAPLPPAPTRAQVLDMQGDLMLYVPDLTLSCGAADADPRSGIRCHADNGGQPRGLLSGWVWTLAAPYYRAAADRELLYQAVHAHGWTHFPVQVDTCVADGGYHGLFPRTPEDCAGWTDRLNTVLRELRAHGLAAICAGATPDTPLQPGVDTSLCAAAMDDWDNAREKDCRIDYLQRTFPGMPIFVEMPGAYGSDYWPLPDACSTVAPTQGNGGEWIRSVQRRDPDFAGVLIEQNIDDGTDANVAYLEALQPFWRDIGIYLFETDTFQKFWSGLDERANMSANDAIRSRVPWLAGYMSSGTAHVPPSNVTVAGGFAGTLDVAQLTPIGGPDFRTWPQTTTITGVHLSQTGVSVTFDKQDGPYRWPDNITPGWNGPLQYSLGLALNVGGVWYASAPIELWYGLAESGGPIQQPGQIPNNWFYDRNRWPQLAGYQPQPGETIGVFVLAGDARNNFNPIQERSDIVLLPLPAPGTEATFSR